MSKKYPYPVQMASIRKSDWRMKRLVNGSASLPRLLIEEIKLWRQIKKIADNAKKPPETCDFFSDSKLIGYGWKWAVYELPGAEVAKVPAGTFREVNDPKYLKNTEDTYKVHRSYLREFVVETSFERASFENKEFNILRQRKINGKEMNFVIPRELSGELREDLSKLALGMLGILDEYEWMPDMHLWRKRRKGKGGWNIWNLIVENKKPVLFDFTAYYDVWRLYPQRTERKKRINKRRWQEFLSELS